ncbi:MAG: pantoate--beta-alanine ligase [Methylophilaceae bacterium]
MQVVETIAALRNILNTEYSVAFVPTMGNLHAGHLHLVEIAKQYADCVVVSVFVNPLQFGANEDLANYPRTLAADCEKLAAVGAHMVFTPSTDEVYPESNGKLLNQTMTIHPPAIADELCGRSRPGHFAGVATVVMKLFNIVQPTIAVFGKKDFQQLFIIKELVKQFNYPITIIAGETVREKDGLAMSSRNSYLSDSARASANQLNSALQDIVNQIDRGSNNYKLLEIQAKNTLSRSGWLVDYIAIRAAATLKPATTLDQALVVLGAAKLGTTRLIDNIEFCAKPLN